MLVEEVEAERVEPVRSRTMGGVGAASLGGWEVVVEGVGAGVVGLGRGTLVMGEEEGGGGDGSEEVVVVEG